MKYRMLGKTKLYVSEIAFGSWGIGSYIPGLRAYGPKYDPSSCIALEEALENGINIYDTANSYGFGHSERLIGKVLKNDRDKIVIASKGGFLNHFPTDGINQKFDVKSLMRSLVDSLFRLETNYIDIYQLHSPSWNQITDEDGLINDSLCRFFDQAKAAGLIRFIGFAAKTPYDALQAVKQQVYPFDVIQVNFNLTDQRAIDCGLFEAAQQAGIGLMTRSPLVHGFLTGSVNADKELHPSDHRLRFTEETQKRWNSAIDIFDKVFIKDFSHTQNALRFCLSFPNIGTVISGMNTPEQVVENSLSSGLPQLTHSEMVETREKYAIYFAPYPVEMKNEK